MEVVVYFCLLCQAIYFTVQLSRTHSVTPTHTHSLTPPPTHARSLSLTLTLTLTHTWLPSAKGLFSKNEIKKQAYLSAQIHDFVSVLKKKSMNSSF